MKNTRNNYVDLGVTEILNVLIKKELSEIQNFIYEKTKHLLINHNKNLNIEKKIKLPFKEIPKEEEWSKLMNSVNESKVLDYRPLFLACP